MFLVPVIMNALAFWVQDNFLMKKKEKGESNGCVVGDSGDESKGM